MPNMQEAGNMRIAILGWGSLLWDQRPAFDAQHESWQDDGPEFNLEFSRISAKTRAGALTLVVDDEHGALCRVAWCLSRRATIDEAAADLREREGTILRRIGRLHVATGRISPREIQPPSSLIAWARSRGLDGVVWTGLPSNYQAETGRPFTVADALSYLQNLEAAGQREAVAYVQQAPDFIATPLRTTLLQDDWFMAAAARMSR
jgi:hypothetical protein